VVCGVRSGPTYLSNSLPLIFCVTIYAYLMAVIIVEIFQIMLTSPFFNESGQPRVVLNEMPSCEAVFEEFLRYFYTGRIALDHATCIPLVSLADKYNVRNLLDVGLRYMARHIGSACRRGLLVSWYQFVANRGHVALAKQFGDFILANFGLMTTRRDFVEMEAATLASFLDCSDMVIKDEMTLFKAVESWLKAKKSTLAKTDVKDIDRVM